MAKYKSTGGGTVPMVLDGTGLTTSVPLLIKNGKQLAGVEVQVTGTAASGFILRDSSGVQQGALGFSVAATDWVATGAVAGDTVLTGPTTGNKNLIIKAVSGASGEIRLLAPASNGPGVAAGLSLGDSSGAKLYYGANNVNCVVANTTVTGPLAVSASTSLAAVALQIAGDPNTGIGAIGGADTISAVAGGTEMVRVSTALVSIAAGKLSFPAGTTQATVGANGAAAALTALPVGYIKVDIAGAAMIVPYYNA